MLKTKLLLLILMVTGCIDARRKTVSVKCTLLKREALPKGKYGYMTYITTWDCGLYGILVSTDETVFRWGKEKSSLLITEDSWVNDYISAIEGH